MKIANKIGLSFLAVTVICTVAALSFLYFTAKSDLQRSIEANLTSIAESREKHIETYLAMLKTSVGQLSKSPSLNDLLIIADKDNLQLSKEFVLASTRLRQTKEANPAIYEFLLLDKTGRVIASSDERSIGSNKSTDAYFLGGQKGIFIKDVYYLESINEPLIAVSAPFLDTKTGELLGVLVARVKLNDLWNITTNRTGLGETGEIILVNRHKVMITPSRYLKDTVLKQKTDTELVRQAFLHQDTEFVPTIFADYRGVPVLGAHGYIPEMQWVVAAKIDAKEAFAPLVGLRWILFVILFIMILVAWLLSRGIAKLIAGPIKKLHKGTEIIGSGNLDYKVGTDTNDEVGQLSRAFDNMTENLKTTTTSVGNLNKEIAGRKRTEEKLREREEDLAITLRSIGDAMIATDAEGRVTRMNPVAEQLTGWPLAEAVGKPMEDVFRIINAQTREPVENPIAKVLASGKIVGLANHTALIARDGTVRQIADSAAPIRDAEGRIRGVVLVFHDVSAEYQIKEALRKSEQSLLEAQVIARIGRWELDLATNRLAWSDGIFELFEVSRETFAASYEAFLTFIHPDDRALVDHAYRESVESKKPYEVEHRLLMKDGRIKWVNEIGRTEYDAGNPVRSIGTVQDITLRKRAEEELRETKDYLESLISYANAPIIVWDPQFHITRFNHAFESLTGRKTGEVIGKPLSILFPADQVESSMEIIRKTLSGERWEDVEIRILLADGTDRIVLWNSATIYGTDGKTPVATIAQGHDITERKRAEEALSQAKADLERANKQLQDAFELESKLTTQAQAANTAKSRFLANMSHEIRTPMNGVIGICELLLDTKMTNEQLKYAQTINSSAQALLHIISATLDFSKIEAGKIELEQIDFNLSNIVEHLISVLGVNAAQKKLELVGSIEPNVPLNLNGDPGRLQQVLSNLIANAIKFTSKGKIAITVALTEEKEDKAVLRFSVRDTGIGIPADKTNLLFSAFTQADASMTRKFGGTGLGLVISKGLVEQMGGSIGVESVPGQGSTFWFIIPFLKQRADGGPSKPTEPAEVTGKVLEVKPLRVLVAEDNMTNQMVVLGILKKMGHIANAVADGKEAVKALETIPYDLVLMDIQMPEMNGLEATAIIRDPKSRVRDHNIPILAFTAHTMPEDRKQCMSAGMNGYITKPVSIKSVAAAIANIATPGNAPVPTDNGMPIPSDEPTVVFDSRALSDQLSGDNAIIREVINIFLKETPKIMYELEQAIKKQQGNDAARLIHAIKGSAANIRGNQFRAVTVKVEAACKAENWPAAEALIPQLKKQFKRLDLAMREFLKTFNEG